ncbi:MAG TPA: hypothetical protein VF530_09290 [Planctomycetota bacterium]
MTLPAAQELPQINTRLRIVDAKTQEPLPEMTFILRDGDGLQLAPQVGPGGELSFVNRGRKLILDPIHKGPKQVPQSIVLEEGRPTYVTLYVDAITGRIESVEQKPVQPDIRPNGKTRQPGSSSVGFGGGAGSDNCNTPGSVGCNASVTFSNVGYTTVPADPTFTCRIGGVAQGFGTAWYTFMATGTMATIDTNGSVVTDTLLAVYSGTCGALVQIGCDDDAGDGLRSLVNVAGLTIGQTYYIQVAGWAASNTGSITLNVSCSGGGGGGGNNECASAQVVTCDSSTAFSNAANTTNPTDPIYTCRVGGPAQGFGTTWFSFVATGTGATLDTEGSAVSDTLLAVYSGACGALVEIGCDDDAGTGFLSLVNVGGLTIGQTYYVQVAGWGAGNLGNMNLNISCSSGATPGDACADALDVECGGSASFNNSLFTTDPDDPAYSCRFGGPGQGVNAGWMKFVATDTSAQIDTLGSTAFDTMLAVYDGTCGAFVELACNDDAFGLLSSLCVDGLIPGNTYYIQASSFSAFDTGDIQVNVECPCPLPPGNDECENAEGLAVPGSVTFDNSLATDDIAVPCGVFSGPFKNVWYLVAGTGGTMSATTCNTDTLVTDTKISVFCADCGDLVCVTGNDDNCPAGGPIFSSTVSWCSQVGANYLITVGNFSSGTTPGQIRLDVSTSGSGCTPTVVCLPQGACCLPDGSCVVATAGDCEAQMGTYQGDGTECTSNAVVDGGFEAGVFSGNWAESSTNFGTPLCDTGSCGFGGGTGPNSGMFWAWFGGIPAFEEGAVSQAVTIPVGATTLDFWLEIPVSSGNGVDFLELTVDGNQEYLVLESAGPFGGYILQQVDISGYADGGVHTIEFHSIITGAGGLFTNFFVDDVGINSVAIECPLPIDCFVLDFETDDSGASIGHGDRINSEFDGGASFPVTITGAEAVSGDNTLAAFNSTTGPSVQDPDLLVGSGNILILQHDGNQSLCGPDTYCSHNDDDDGGTMDFAFNVPVTVSSITLIDVDSTDATWIVNLFDSNGDQRTWNVPAGWTGDLIADATSGMGVLDLTSLAPQPGFMGQAVVGEIGDFDADDVVMVRVNLGGSGAVDNLSWCQPNM